MRNTIIAVGCSLILGNSMAQEIVLNANYDHIRFTDTSLSEEYQNYFVALQTDILLKNINTAKELGDDAITSQLYRKVAEFYYNLGQYQLAIEYLDSALRINSTNADALYLRGLCYFELEDYASASADFSLAVQINPELKGTHFPNGIARFELGDYAGAITEFTQYLTLRTDNEIAYFFKGITHLRLKQYPQAIEAFSQATVLNPEYDRAYFYQAVTYSDMRDFTTAKYYYQKAIAAEAEYEFAYVNFTELNLILNEPLNDFIYQTYKQKFAQSENMIYVAMLEILFAIATNQPYDLAQWQKEYSTTKNDEWSYDLIMDWISTKDSATRILLNDAIEVFKSHQPNE